MHTGGGEFLASPADELPLDTTATEAFEPNIPVATQRLTGLGVQGDCCIERSAGGAPVNLPVGHPDRESDAVSKAARGRIPALRLRLP